MYMSWIDVSNWRKLEYINKDGRLYLVMRIFKRSNTSWETKPDKQNIEQKKKSDKMFPKEEKENKKQNSEEEEIEKEINKEEQRKNVKWTQIGTSPTFDD